MSQRDACAIVRTTVDDGGKISEVRTRLSYMSPRKERNIDAVVAVSRSRFISAAVHPIRFYKEYFQADQERTLDKDRRRWSIMYQGVQFYVNVDQVINPPQQGLFIEIKSNTSVCSRCRFKAAHVQEIYVFGLAPEDIVTDDYLEILPEQENARINHE